MKRLAFHQFWFDFNVLYIKIFRRPSSLRWAILNLDKNSRKFVYPKNVKMDSNLTKLFSNWYKSAPDCHRWLKNDKNPHNYIENRAKRVFFICWSFQKLTFFRPFLCIKCQSAKKSIYQNSRYFILKNLVFCKFWCKTRHCRTKNGEMAAIWKLWFCRFNTKKAKSYIYRFANSCPILNRFASK